MEDQVQRLKEAKEALQKVCVKEVLSALRKNQMEAIFVPNSEEALKIVLSLIPEGSKVGYGGSWTLNELGIKQVLKEGNYHLIDRDRLETSDEEMFLLRRESLLADIFLCSVNALTRDGKLVNIDGIGNRLAALAFGPKKVIIVVGINKIVKDLDRGLERIRNYVAPIHAYRRGWDVPCAKTGACIDCHSPQRICGTLTVTEFQREKDRISVILVGEPLGI